MTFTLDEFSEWNQQLLARQAVTRRSLLLAAMAGLGGQFALARRAFAAAGGTAGSAGVVVSGRHLSFVPGAGDVPRDAMAVTAQLVSATGAMPAGLRAFVDVGDAPGVYGTRVEAGIRHLTGMYAIPGGPVGSQFYAKARITGLKPDTVYHYRLRLSDGTVTGDAHFTTAPAAAKPFTFTAFADVGTDTAPKDPAYAWTGKQTIWPRGVFDNQEYGVLDPVGGPKGTDKHPASSMTRLMSTQRPAFTLLAGDICYANPSGTGLPADDTTALTTGRAPAGKNLYNPYVWDVFLHQIEPQAAYTPWMFATGNHDMEPLYGSTSYLGGSPSHGYGGHVQRLDFPATGPQGCPSVYRFVYGNVGLISLDANELSWELQTNLGYSGGAQVAWLKETLKRWRTAGSGVDFIVVFLHHCAFSTAHNHASDGGVRAAIDPLFSKYRVDLAVQGHNHLFERTDPIRHGRRTKAAPDGATVNPEQDGTVYVCVGSGGRPRYQFRPKPGVDAPAPAGVTPTGEQQLPEGQRYRGHKPSGRENSSSTVTNSYFWAKDKHKPKKGKGAPTGLRVPESVDWSQVRYDGYAFIAVDVVPAARAGGETTLTVRTLADALPGTGKPYTEIDRITLKRTSSPLITG
ncbi:purple acid phosphatase family protein [Actinoplanes sp. HUAS TT8]|uniref:purple acid phosphatase family protein n=1 Tax=Actinoplanes sp. HUAS TT8 TaxID=3447453 RepID=UPI003F522BCE